MMAADNSFDAASLPGISPDFETFNDFDDTVAFGEGLSFGQDQVFPLNWDQQTPPYEENLYSAPLSWDEPVTKFEPLSMASNITTMNTLTLAQQEKLRSIAMPQHLRYRSQNSPHSTASTKSQSISSPDSNGRENNRKRKSSTEVEDDEDDDDENAQHPPVKKTAHNMIEKRYRTNLNDKIAALRDSVPSLRIMTKSAKGEDTADDREELQGLTPAHKLNKATVLSKATEYINHLEKRNKRLQDENTAQRARLAAFETLFRSGSMGFNPAPLANPFQYPPDYTTPGASPVNDPQGMIQVPEDIRRLHAGMNQQTYQVPQEQYRPQGRQPIGPNGWQNGGIGGGYFGKLMVGSLAGLMIMEGFSESEQQNESPSARGLFALPTQVFRMASQALHSSLDFSMMGYHMSAAQTLGYVKVFLIFGSLLYVFLPSLFAIKPSTKNGKIQSANISAAPSLASSIHVRRQAWLTAIQTVWVPRHNFFLEAAALCLKTIKLSMRNVIGSRGYAYITGITQQQEAARVKAWTIALDAQLAGGDVEVSISRLTLTLLASGTLPDTPTRLMMKAIHIRVLLWEIGNAGFNRIFMFQDVAATMARWKWNEARQLQQLLTHTKEKEEDAIPEYLVALLEHGCDDVLTDSIGQRAYNLAWNLPTSHNIQGSSEDMDSVVNDFAIRSPLDAVAAWYSTLVLQGVLTSSLQTGEAGSQTQKETLNGIDLAIRTAPIGSGAQIRALVARAILVKEKRGYNIATSLKALGPFESPDNGVSEGPNLIHTSTSITALPDIKMSLRCAMAIAHLERFPAPANPETAHKIIGTINITKLTLLGFTAAFTLMERIYSHKLVAVTCSDSLERLAGSLRIWIGGREGERSGLDKETKREMVDKCLAISKHVVGLVDAGYGSMSEGDLNEEVGEDC